VKNDKGEIGYAIWAGGGQGRTPFIAHRVRAFCPKDDLLGYMEAILRVYNEYGRRDNIHKARVKILAHQLGADEFRRQVEVEFAEIKRHGTLHLPPEELKRIEAYFAPPAFEDLPETAPEFEAAVKADAGFAAWAKSNLTPHKAKGYAIATISLKTIGQTPGDASAEQMEGLAQIMEDFGFAEIRVSHEQNLVFPHVRKKDLPAVYARLQALDLGAANAGLITDIICCPGLDYCDLANARSIPVAMKLQERFADLERQHELGEIKIKMSGCINACGHHHAGHIGILGVDKKGVEFYQIQLGGSGAEDASVGEIMGPGFGKDEIVDAVERVVETYVALRAPGERLLETYRRVGMTPFKNAAYQEQMYAAY
jgi:sulfite reductase (NADPH) hemoprotein beta-component